MSREWWKTHFNQQSLEGYGLPKKNQAEVRAVGRLLGLKAPASILDLCCGAGRHALGLAALGHRVTGLDWSKDLLSAAQSSAAGRDLRLKFQRGDMRKLAFGPRFDAVINLFTSFGYFETEAADLAVLRGVRRSLRPGGLFLIDLLNKEWLMRHFTPTFWQKNPEGDVLKAHNRLSFDLKSSRLDNQRTVFTKTGKRETHLRFKVYTLHDLDRLLKASGLQTRQVWGGFDGRPYALDSFRMIVLAQRPTKRPAKP